MEELDLLREFYYHSEQDCKNDFQLGAMNSAYCKIEKKLKALDLLDKKNVKIIVLKNSKNLKDYNDFCLKCNELTQEQWQFLKEEVKQ